MPRSTRSPPTMSLAVLESSPIRWRWCALRRSSGRSSGPISSISAGHADEDEQAERDRRAEQDDRDQEERDDRAGEPRGHVHHLAEVGDVVGADRDHLAGRDLARQGAAEVDGLAADQLHGAVGRGQPVRDREPVPHDPGDRLDQPDREHQAGVLEQRGAVLGGDAAVDRAADHGRHHRLAAHPDDAEEHAADEGLPLAARHPPEERAGRAVLRRPGVVEREAAHSLKGTERDPSRATRLSARRVSPRRRRSRSGTRTRPWRR